MNIKKRTTPKEIKDKYYNDLESNIVKTQRFKNQKTINCSYLENDIFPKILDNSNFPPPMYSDDINFRSKFYNELIINFKKDILKFNITHINNELENLNKNKLIVGFFLDIDHDVDQKIDILKTKIKEKHDPFLKKGIEKINRLISNKEPKNIENKIDNESKNIHTIDLTKDNDNEKLTNKNSYYISNNSNTKNFNTRFRSRSQAKNNYSYQMNHKYTYQHKYNNYKQYPSVTY
ncbi:unnamed protein product [Brachionus calyciflorus]|uniref:Uncharacterized protein n=1 Tax=Brachionus calyciflorus TaxID=104777 RepID=A0A814FHQ2_9BILA|nr:unnamed protein product [Brachionus calyciflorus]